MSAGGWIPRDADDTADLRATVHKLTREREHQAAAFAVALSRQESIAQAARAYVAARERFDAALLLGGRNGQTACECDACEAAYDALAAAVRGEQPNG